MQICCLSVLNCLVARRKCALSLCTWQLAFPVSLVRHDGRLWYNWKGDDRRNSDKIVFVVKVFLEEDTRNTTNLLSCTQGTSDAL